METVPGLLESAAQWRPEHPLFWFEGRTHTYGEVNADANRLAHALRGIGLASETPVALYLPSRPVFAVAYYGAIKAGGIAAALNFMFKTDEVRAMVNYLEAGVLLTTPEGLANVLPIAGQMPTLRHIAVLREGRRTELPAGVVDLETIMAAASPSDPPQPFRPDDVAAIFHTSGTTGLPKGAAQTHVNIVVGARQMAYFTGYRMLAERQVCPLPLFNNFGSTAVMNLNVNCLGSIALLERWDTAAVLDAFVRLGCNRFMGTPTMFIYLLQGHDPAVHGEVALGRCLVAGQKCPPEVRAAFEERFSCRLIDAYGATETHFITSMTAHGDNPEGTVGHPVGHATVRVEDDSGAEVGPGVVGELVLGADTVCAGYWRNPEKTAESFGPHGWRSGDLGFRDENGFYHIVDRKKDLIITGGMNIYPAEIEAVLYEHPGVAVATVIGMPDEVKGEIPRAYVVPKDGSEVTPAEILAWCREKMAVYKVPRDVVFMAELPLSPVGKVLKRELREQLLAQIG